MQCPKNDAEQKRIKYIPYAFVVSSLMYVKIYIRLDINFAVEIHGRYQNNLGNDYWKAAKKVEDTYKEQGITCSCIRNLIS